MFKNRKIQRILAVFSILLLHIGTSSISSWALPNGATVVNGQVGFSTTDSRMTIANSPGSIINWQGFSIDRNELVNFIQQNSASSVLNRVVGQNPSAILGALESNGRVFLINPNGILFGQGARIDVGGLVASTLDISNADFLAGQLNFAGDPDGRIENQGEIATPSGGLVYLIAPDIKNSGIITAPDGNVTLAAGHQVELIDSSNPELAVVVSAPEDKALNLGQIVAQSGSIGIYGALIEQQGLVSADSAVSEGGKIVFRASNRAELTQQSSTSANGFNGGDIQIDAAVAMLDGDLSANGGTGGSISVTANNFSQHGAIMAEGADGDGGSVHLQAGNALIQDAGAHISVSATEHAGQVVVEGDASLFSSATVRANSASGGGGNVQLLGEQITLLGATVSADGASGGGEVLIGGDYQGSNPAIRNAGNTGVNFSTRISADATESGDGGKVVVWSDQQTDYYGDISATGGSSSGDGGLIEVSGKENLVFGGTADASATNGAAGSLLLDPKNITIDDAGTGTYASVNLVDPNPGSSYQFGDSTAVLPVNGNIVVTSPYADFSATNGGAAHLFDGSSGALISSLWGDTANDYVGLGGITTLSNGNFLIRSPDWDNGAATSAGAVTWGSGTAGVTGIVSSTNSLVGSSTNDLVGSSDTDSTGFPINFRIQELTNGNYVLLSHVWDNGGIADAGAVTWGNGATGTSGVISAANSLVGSTANDQLGYTTWFNSGIGITALTNGNYVVNSPMWDNAGIVDAGAVTWGDGTTGISGTIDATNSLVGSSTNDQLGYSGNSQNVPRVVGLTNGNYVVKSPFWDNGGISNAGAATWGDGTTGISGTIDASNSLVGTTAYDEVGRNTVSTRSSGVAALTNGNYVVISYGNGAGAATWADGTIGISGTIDATNSLIGEAGDWVGNGGVTALNNGHYVVSSPYWWNGGTEGAGAVTWGNGTGGTTGLVTSANSLVGTGYRYYVGSGGVVGLTNGNYVIVSPFNFINNQGTVTWADGTGTSSGIIEGANSLYGTSANDNVGSGGITALANGNYVVLSPDWDSGGISNVGAVTWGNGTTGTTGAVSVANSLVGSTATDEVGLNIITGLANSNYLVSSYKWNNYAGAVTWGDGNGGTAGVVSSANSLVGSTSNDYVGSNGFGSNRITVLSNGNYVVNSFAWDNGGVSDAGASTWGDGTTGVAGEISPANSLVGTRYADNVGIGFTALSNGNYVVDSYNWNNGVSSYVGAVTWGDGTTGINGVIDSSNSLLGGDSGDNLGSGGVRELSGDRFVVSSPDYGTGYNYNGRVEIVSLGGSSDPATGQIYAANPDSDITIDPSAITDILDTGTALVLQANNDITLSQNLTTSGGGSGGDLTLQAGRSVLLNADITTDNGNLTVIGNDTAANGVVDANRDAGAAEITMASGTSIDAGTGNVTIALRDGAGNTNTTSGDITLRDISGDTISVVNAGPTAGSGIQLDGTLTAGATTGDSIVLAGDTFVNNTGAGLFSLTGSSRWLVWSDDPAADTRGGLSYDFKQYNATYGSSSVSGSNNGFLYTLAPTITAALTGAISRTYEGTTTATLIGANYSNSGAVDGDTITLNNPASGTYDTKHVGTGKSVSVSGLSIAAVVNGAAPVYGYQLASTTASGGIGTITTADLTLSTNDISRAYDGSTAAAGTAIVTAGSLFGTDSISGGTFSYDTRHVGTGKTVTVSGVTLNDGNSGNNYNVTYADNNNSSITTVALTISTSNVSKVYDQTTTAAGTAVASGGTTVFGTDNLNGGTFSFDNKNVGSGKTVTVSGVTVSDGNSGNNYTVTYADNTSSTITAKAITAAGITADNKIYDATTTAVINTSAATLNAGATNATDNRYYTGDTVALDASGASGSFTDKNVANGKAVSISGMSLSGADASNYLLTGISGTTADIAPAALTLNGFTAADKVYDGNVAATITNAGTLAGVIGADTVTHSNSGATFADKNVGNGKTVTLSGISLAGADGGNYTVASTATDTANITARLLTISGITADNRVYDGTTDATVRTGSAIYTGLVNGDNLTVAVTGSFSDKNVGSGKTVTLNSSYSGADTGNYSITDQATTTADITVREVSLAGLSAADKAYDGNTDSTIASYGTLTGIISGETVDVDQTSGNASFDNPNVGTDKIVRVTALGLTGADAGNYFIDDHQTLADITGSTPTQEQEVMDNANRIIQSSLENTIIPALDGTVAAPAEPETRAGADGPPNNPDNQAAAGNTTAQGDNTGDNNSVNNPEEEEDRVAEAEEKLAEVDEVISAKGGKHVQAKFKPYCN